MNVMLIQGLTDAEKQKLMERTLGFSPEEQSVVISCIPDAVLAEEIAYRLTDRNEKLCKMDLILGGMQ